MRLFGWLPSTYVLGMVKTSRTLFSLFPRRREAKIHYYLPPPSKYLLLPSPINNLTPNPNSHWARNVKCPFCGGGTKTMHMINIGATETFFPLVPGLPNFFFSFYSKVLLLLLPSHLSLSPDLHWLGMEWNGGGREREACATLSISKRGEGEELSPEPKTSGGFNKISFPYITTALFLVLFDKNTFVRHSFIEVFLQEERICLPKFLENPPSFSASNLFPPCMQ